MRLYHTGSEEVRVPDILKGRKNTDFGQGFYLSPDRDFSYRWAMEGSVLNEYEIDLDGLRVIRLERDEEWFGHIFNNRRGVDKLNADVVIGPIANDTIFETLGIVSSGFLKPAEALKILKVGPEYTQWAIKTQRAAGRLRWIRSERAGMQAAGLRRAEQEAYDAALAGAIKEILGEG